MATLLYVNDIGTQFIVTIKDKNNAIIDISNATMKKLIFLKPDTTVLSVTPSFYTDGTDGNLSYITVSGDINQYGTWKLQGHIENANGSWNSDVYTLPVYRNIY